MSAEHHAGPLERTPPENEHHPGPLAPVEQPRPQRAPRPKKKWHERRWERRRRRRMFEEILGWVLVPLIVLACFWAVKGTLGAFGTNFTALVQGVRTAISSAGRGG